jgi:hypothetical protein
MSKKCYICGNKKGHFTAITGTGKTKEYHFCRYTCWEFIRPTVQVMAESLKRLSDFDRQLLKRELNKELTDKGGRVRKG